MKRTYDNPQPGFFRMRLVKRGPWVPARIWRPCACTVNGPEVHAWRSSCDRHCALTAEIAGNEADLWKVWESGRPIDEPEFNYLSDIGEWAEAHAPHLPEANPSNSINLREMPSLY